MTIDVRRIAKLARLKIADEEVAPLTQEMENIVKMVEHLPPLEGEGALLDTGNTMQLRPDVARPSYPREKILQNAPETAEGCFLVPKTVD